MRAESGITRLRGQAYQWWGRFLVPTFHPAAALRGSQRVYEEMRYDFGLVKDVLEGRLRTNEAEPSDEVEIGPSAPDPEQLDLFG